MTRAWVASMLVLSVVAPHSSAEGSKGPHSQQHGARRLVHGHSSILSFLATVAIDDRARPSSLSLNATSLRDDRHSLHRKSTYKSRHRREVTGDSVNQRNNFYDTGYVIYDDTDNVPHGSTYSTDNDVGDRNGYLPPRKRVHVDGNGRKYRERRPAQTGMSSLYYTTTTGGSTHTPHHRHRNENHRNTESTTTKFIPEIDDKLMPVTTELPISTNMAPASKRTSQSFPTAISPNAITSAPITKTTTLAAESVEVDSASAESASSSSVYANEVVWGALCSPRFVLVYRRHDVSLRCEVWVPLGTTITWSKDSRTLRTDLDQTSREGHSEPYLSSDYSGTTQNLQTTFFLDCANHGHRGTYELMVHSPSGNTYSRQFTVIVVEYFHSRPSPPSPSNPPLLPATGLMCTLPPHLRRLMPRIHAFSHAVYAPHGTNVTLPCRHDGDQMRVSWMFQDRPATEFEVTDAGDLVIPSVGPHHEGFFMCSLKSLLLPQLQDRIVTALRPQL